MIKKRTLLTNWLKAKKFHIRDIAIALQWYDEQCKGGFEPKDKAVYDIAEKCYLEAIKKSKDQVPTVSLDIKYKIKSKMMIVSFVFGVLGSSMFFLIVHGKEAYQWVLELMQYLLLQMG